MTDQEGQLFLADPAITVFARLLVMAANGASRTNSAPRAARDLQRSPVVCRSP